MKEPEVKDLEIGILQRSVLIRMERDWGVDEKSDLLIEEEENECGGHSAGKVSKEVGRERITLTSVKKERQRP